MQTKRNSIRKKITTGKYVEHNALSICKINDFYPLISGKIMYQVHCFSPRCKHSALYEDVEEAISTFLELRKKLR
jgi:hypothetical protein